MVQDFLIILHVCSQILNFNLYAIQVTFVGTKILDIMHFVTNSIELLLLIFCIFAWNRCGFKFHSLIAFLQLEKLVIICIFAWNRCGLKIHSLIVFLQLEKLVIVCIHYTLTDTIFVILYRSFLTVQLGINAFTILAECMLLCKIHKKYTNIPQQHELNILHDI